jgi:hypothetical protein
VTFEVRKLGGVTDDRKKNNREIMRKIFWYISYHSHCSIKVVIYTDVELRRGCMTIFILNSERNEIFQDWNSPNDRLYKIRYLYTEGADSLTIIVCIYPEEGTTYRYIAGEVKVLRQCFCFVGISI